MQLPELTKSPWIKAEMAACTFRRCRNWFSILLSRLRLRPFKEPIQLRNGLKLNIMGGLPETWMEVFCPAIADIYEIEQETPDLIVDVGGNIGSFSCLAALTHPRAKVLVFEPSVRALEYLKANIALNRLSNLVIVEKALTADGRDVHFQDVGNGGGSNIMDLDASVQSVPMKSSAVSEISYTASREVFFKLDCEGAEGEILTYIAQSRAALPAKVTIACEWHTWCPFPKDQVVNDLKQAGFRVREYERYGESHLRLVSTR